GRKCLEAIPNGILSLFASGNELEFFAKAEFSGEVAEGVLHAVSNDHDDFRYIARFVESSPGVTDNGAAIEFEEQLVDVRPHASAFSGGDNKGGGHFRGMRRPANRAI